MLALTVAASVAVIAVIGLIIDKLIRRRELLDLEVRARLPVALDLEPRDVGWHRGRERVRRRRR